MLSPRAFTLLSLILAYAMWSTGFVLVKVTTAWLGSIAVMTLRMVPPLVVYLLLWKKIQPAKWRREDMPWLAFMVLCDPIISIGLQTKALPLTTASQSGVIFACIPLLMAVAARVLFGETIRRRCTTGILIAFFGVTVVALTGKATVQAPNPLLGNLFSFLAICALLCYTLTVKRLAAHYKPYTLLCVQAMGAACIHFPLLAIFGPAPEVWLNTPWYIYVALLYMGLFPACLGYFLVNRAISLIKAAHVSLLNGLVPVFVLFIGYFALDERLQPLQYMGAAMVFGGALLAGIPEESQTPSSIKKA